MKKSVLGKEGTPSASYNQDALLDRERFKLRMTRFLESMDDLWDEYERLKKYSPEQEERNSL